MLAPALILTTTAALILLAAAAQALLATDDYAEPLGDVPFVPRGARVNLEPSHSASIAGERR